MIVERGIRITDETKNISTDRHPDVEARNRTENRERDFEEINREIRWFL